MLILKNQAVEGCSSHYITDKAAPSTTASRKPLSHNSPEMAASCSTALRRLFPSQQPRAGCSPHCIPEKAAPFTTAPRKPLLSQQPRDGCSPHNSPEKAAPLTTSPEEQLSVSCLDADHLNFTLFAVQVHTPQIQICCLQHRRLERPSSDAHQIVTTRNVSDSLLYIRYCMR